MPWKRSNGEGELAALGDVEIALDPDQVADVEILDPRVGLLPQGVKAGVGLDRAGEIADVEEGRLAVPSLPGQAAGDAVGEVGVVSLSKLSRVVRLEYRLDLRAVGEIAWEGVDARGAQPLDLGAALARGALQLIGGRVRFAHRTVPTVTRSPPMWSRKVSASLSISRRAGPW
jgi:hypothetical protein